MMVAIDPEKYFGNQEVIKTPLPTEAWRIDFGSRDPAGPDGVAADQGPRVQGVGPDAPIVTNDKGGRQSHTPYGFILMDAKAMFKLAEVLQHGADKYGRDNWRKVDCEDHVNHALMHIYAWMAGDKQEDHLSHAFCRLMMAIGTEEVKNASNL